jgi:hypothetical protein
LRNLEIANRRAWYSKAQRKPRREPRRGFRMNCTISAAELGARIHSAFGGQRHKWIRLQKRDFSREYRGNNLGPAVLLRDGPLFKPSAPLLIFTRISIRCSRMQPRGGEIPIISQIARILNNRC